MVESADIWKMLFLQKKIEEKKKKEKKKVLRAKLSNDGKSIDDVYLPSTPDFSRTHFG